MKSVHSDAYVALTGVLKAARERAGMTQQDVADKLGRPQSFVAKYERSERRLDVVEFIEIARVLRAEPSKLFALVLKGI